MFRTRTKPLRYEVAYRCPRNQASLHALIDPYTQPVARNIYQRVYTTIVGYIWLTACAYIRVHVTSEREQCY